ncbi:unnamed protein product [Brassica rapa subsp. trilocularis]
MTICCLHLKVRDLNLADDVETVTEEEIVVSVNRTSERILHREDGAIRDPELHRLKRDVELITRDSFKVRVSFFRLQLRSTRRGLLGTRHGGWIHEPAPARDLCLLTAEPILAFRSSSLTERG